MKRILVPVLLVLLACVVVSAAGIGLYLFRSKTATRPAVLFNAPVPGKPVPVGEPVAVHALARDDQMITRIELWVDGQLQQAQASNLARGVSSLPLVTHWLPNTAGSHVLMVRAFNAAGARSHATLNVNAIQPVDRDNDGVVDRLDPCPDQPGSPAANGCPDQDNDGVADATDACPAVPGPAGNRGCAVPIAGDRDGDGSADGVDACPDQPGAGFAGGCPDGDGDGVRDAADACPNAQGLPGSNGCPTPGDRDGDAVADATDACPEEPGDAPLGCPDDDGDGVAGSGDQCPDDPGLAGLAGCPDRDGDGVRDRDDLCPAQAGPAANGGCPATGSADRDRDGLTDEVDFCPEETGAVGQAGCPPPGNAADRNSNGISDDGEVPPDPVANLFRPLLGALLRVQSGMNSTGGAGSPGRPKEAVGIVLEVTEFRVSQDLDQLSCYYSIDTNVGDPVIGFTGSLDNLQGRYWNLELVDGENSRMLFGDTLVPVNLYLECWGITAAGPVSLGVVQQTHARPDWQGQQFERGSDAASRAEQYWVTYHLCEGACAGVAFHPPQIELFDEASGPYLSFMWTGDSTAIGGFAIYRNGSVVQSFDPHDHASPSPGWGCDAPNVICGLFRLPDNWAPPCGEEYRLHMTAFGSDRRESAPSNVILWRGEACPHCLRITFDSIVTGDLGNDWWKATHGGVGPITGSFWASGGNVRTLDFDAAAGAYTGYFLPDHRTIPVTSIFNSANQEGLCGGSTCNTTGAPTVNYVVVEVDAEGTFTVGGEITDIDRYDTDTLFSTQREFNYVELATNWMNNPGSYPSTITLSNRNTSVTVIIQEVMYR